MKRLMTLLAGISLCAASSVFAHDYKVDNLEIDHPWSRATVAAVPTGAVYFVVNNPGTTMDRLVSVSTPVANTSELHTHIKDGELMRMRKVDAIEIAPASRVALEPGGLHVMLMGLKEPLVKGKAFPLTLVFEEAGPVTVEVAVQGISELAPSQGSSDHNSSGHGAHSGHKH